MAPVKQIYPLCCFVHLAPPQMLKNVNLGLTVHSHCTGKDSGPVQISNGSVIPCRNVGTGPRQSQVLGSIVWYLPVSFPVPVPILFLHSINCSQLYIYRPQTKLRKGNVFTPVCDSVHGKVSVQGDLCPRDLCPGGSLQGGSLPRGVSVTETHTSSTVDEWAVRILLECILVPYIFSFLHI